MTWLTSILGGAQLKAVLIGIAALAILGLITGGYLYVNGLQAKALELTAQVNTLTGDLNLSRFERNIAESRAKDLIAQQDDLTRRLSVLQANRSKNDTELATLRAALSSFDLQKELEANADRATELLNSRTRDLNRMLDGASEF